MSVPIKVIGRGLRGRTGPASGVLGADSVGADEIKDDSGELALIRQKLGLDDDDTPTFASMTLSRSMGALAAGSTTPNNIDTTFSGHAGGTSVLYGMTHRVHATGTSNLATVRNAYYGTDIETTAGTVAVAEGQHNYVYMHGAGNVTDVRIIASHFRLDGAGGVSNSIYHFHAVDLTLGGGSSGNISQVNGLVIGQIGHASRVTTAIGISIADLAASTTVYGLYSDISAGTGKWNLYLNGTASNFIEGNIRFGATSRAANGTGGVSAIGSVAPGSASISVQEWGKVLGAGGALRYVPFYG
jgi:hypothetical protein